MFCFISTVAAYYVQEHHLLHRCPRNEHFVGNSTDCPITCSNRYQTVPGDSCETYSGCVCDEDRVRLFDDATGPCVSTDSCPPDPVYCGPHEEPTECENICLESCAHVYSNEICIASNLCIPGCKCTKNHLRNQLGMCVPRDYCPDSNICSPTCAQPNPPDCPNIDRNVCEPGYILSEIGGVCIKIEDCPADASCNSDPNAIIAQCPQPCPSTCEAPNAVPCKKMCEPVGCECKPGFIRSKVNGKCILLDQCPGGNPCGDNATFMNCRVPCITDYCPVNDTRGEVICDIPNPCLSGCVCNSYYKHRSVSDNQCIPAKECPPVKCTRPNEVWDSCPSTCLYENCNDVDNPNVECDDSCKAEPRCVCDENHFRNNDGVCVPAEECPSYVINTER